MRRMGFRSPKTAARQWLNTNYYSEDIHCGDGDHCFVGVVSHQIRVLSEYIPSQFANV